MKKKKLITLMCIVGMLTLVFGFAQSVKAENDERITVVVEEDTTDGSISIDRPLWRPEDTGNYNVGENIEIAITPKDGKRVASVSAKIYENNSNVVSQTISLGNGERFGADKTMGYKFKLTNSYAGDKFVIVATYEDVIPVEIRYIPFNISYDETNDTIPTYINDLLDYANNNEEAPDDDTRIINEEVTTLFNNPDTNTLLVSNYLYGDIVIPSVCTNRNNSNKDACVFQFKVNKNDLGNYSNIKSMFVANSMFSRKEIEGVEYPVDTIISSTVSSDDNYNYYYIVVSEDFADYAQSAIALPDRSFNLYTNNYIGFVPDVDVQNFSDTLFEEGKSILSFTTGNNFEETINIFYGTGKVYMTPMQLKTMICTSGTTCPSMNLNSNLSSISKVGDNYKIVKDNDGKYVLTFNNYYDMDLPLTLKLNFADGTSKEVILNIGRTAFWGNAGALNGYSFDNPDYYTIQYRGVTGVFYSDDCTKTANNVYNRMGDISSLNNTCLRKTDFTPYVYAIYYKDETIVDAKGFDLNSLIKEEGISSSKLEPFTNVNAEGADFYEYDMNNKIAIKNIEYFNSSNITIMEDIKLIKKTDAEKLGITKVALFLTNGPLDNESGTMPALQFGVDSGKVFPIPTDDGGPDGRMQQGGAE